jgi:enamine deaminase RidA (YjgF/YER057c/UK114 family)
MKKKPEILNKQNRHSGAINDFLAFWKFIQPKTISSADATDHIVQALLQFRTQLEEKTQLLHYN